MEPRARGRDGAPPADCYYQGVWNSPLWEKALELLNHNYKADDVENLFSLNSHVRAREMMGELEKVYGKDLIYELILPVIQSLAHTSSDIVKDKIQILYKHQDKPIKITQFQGACIFATTFLCMFGNDAEGHPEEEERVAQDEIRHIPMLSFSPYWGSRDGMMYGKTLFYIRYTLKMAIRMALRGVLKPVSHAKYLTSPKLLREELDKHKSTLASIYDVDMEFELDSKAPNSVLCIKLNEFDPSPFGRSLRTDKHILCDNLEGELRAAWEDLDCMRRTVSDKVAAEDIIGGRIHSLNPLKKKHTRPTLLEVTKEVFMADSNIVDLPTLKGTVVHNRSISNQKEAMTTNFANKILGGGCMGGGNVQEEILVLVAPEIMIARIFVMEMLHTQSISLSGYEIFSRSKGYGWGLEYGGVCVDNTPFEDGSFKSHMVAIDAIPMFPGQMCQFCPIVTLREFIKFVVGVQSNGAIHMYDTIATGKWGCGVFGGNVWMKFLIQLVGCVFCGIKMNFSSFGNDKEKEKFEEFVKTLIQIVSEKKVTRGMLFRSLVSMVIGDEDTTDGRLLDKYILTLSGMK